MSALLVRCTDFQKTQFEKFFPGGVAKQSLDKLETAYDLIQRTLRKNAAVSPPARGEGQGDSAPGDSDGTYEVGA